MTVLVIEMLALLALGALTEVVGALELLVLVVQKKDRTKTKQLHCLDVKQIKPGTCAMASEVILANRTQSKKKKKDVNHNQFQKSADVKCDCHSNACL